MEQIIKDLIQRYESTWSIEELYSLANDLHEMKNHIEEFRNSLEFKNKDVQQDLDARLENLSSLCFIALAKLDRLEAEIGEVEENEIKYDAEYRRGYYGGLA